MLDLDKNERTLLACLEKPDALIYRQAEVFYLTMGGLIVCNVPDNICKRLIELGALVEIGTNDDTEWVYAADPRCFAPNWELGNDQSKG